MNKQNETKKCKYCQTEIDAKAKICPNCKKKQRSSKSIIIAVIAVVFLIGCISMCSNSNTTVNVNNSTPQTTNNAESDAEPQATENTASDSASQSTSANNVPTEYKSALNKAKSYSENMYMSKQGIYDQLTSQYGEKFSAEAAQYAIDNLQADWKANALKKAESYQETMSMSPEAIRDQLTSEYGEKFTQEEADYAIANLK